MPSNQINLVYREFEGFRLALERQIAAYQETHPEVAVDIAAHDVAPLYERMIAKRGCLSGEADLFLGVTDWFPELIRDGMIVCLDDYLRDDPPPDWPDGWPNSLLQLQTDGAGRVYGLPYHNGPEVFMYRTDLFDDPAERTRFAHKLGRTLAPPATWSEFLDLARYFNRPDDGLHGCVVAAKPDGHNDVYDFCLHLWSRGGELLDANFRPVFAGPEGEAALRFYLDLIHEHRVTQPRPWEDDSIRAGEIFANGQAAMMWNWVGFQTMADSPATSQIAGNVRSTMLPAGDGPTGRAVSLIVYWVMTIAAGSRQPDAAWGLLRHLATPAMDKITAVAGGSGVRRSTWNDPEVQRQFGYYAGIEAIHRQARTLPAIPEYPAINEVLNQMMARVVTGGVPIGVALRDASQETEQILAAAGYYADGHRAG